MVSISVFKISTTVHASLVQLLLISLLVYVKFAANDHVIRKKVGVIQNLIVLDTLLDLAQFYGSMH